DATPVSYRDALKEASKTIGEEKRQGKERRDKKENDIEVTRRWYGGLAAGFASAGLLWAAGRGGSKLKQQVQKIQLLNSLYDPAMSEQLERLQKLLYDKPERAHEPINNDNPKYGSELRDSIELLPDFSGQREYELIMSLPNKKSSRKLFKLARLLKD